MGVVDELAAHCDDAVILAHVRFLGTNRGTAFHDGERDFISGPLRAINQAVFDFNQRKSVSLKPPLRVGGNGF